MQPTVPTPSDKTPPMHVDPQNVEWLNAVCPPPSIQHADAARQRQSTLTKPPGSLGALEQIAIRLAGLQRRALPTAEHAQIVIFAADHGVAERGVSAYPSSVTVQMLRNFVANGAAISVLAQTLQASLTVIDVGTRARDPIAGVIIDKVCFGTNDLSCERAIAAADLAHGLAAGRRAIMRLAGTSADIVILGDMGIGNTTAAAAVVAALRRSATADVVGAGSGLDAAGIARKQAIIERALTLHRLTADHPPHDGPGTERALEVLSCVGGLEIAALCGAIIAAGQAGLPVLVDGFIVSVAALAAVDINPSCRPWLLFSHRSAEKGHRVVLDLLDADPLIDLSLRLGEGSGAATALPIVRLACALHAGMATFDEAQVAQAER